MRKLKWLSILGLVSLMALVPVAQAQQRPYIGFVYPAGGQQGTTVQIRLGGQGLDDVTGAIVTGTGVTARLVECHRRLSNQEQQLLNEQLRELKRAKPAAVAPMAPMMAAETPMMSMMAMAATGTNAVLAGADAPATNLIIAIEKRTRDFVSTPACAALATLVFIEVTIAPDAPPGERELRLVTLRGVSNPLVFHVGQLPEFTRKPMLSASIQVLGKEAQSLRKRPPEEAEDRIAIPCTVNGQIASGEVNRYRFTAHKGQRLVLTTLGRQLIPYIADAVPGWFQPVLVLFDSTGKEVAYEDDYRFKPDPVILYEVPNDGEYVFAIHDAIYRGREDFVYRITIGELPFVTSIFPLGGQAGAPVTIKLKGWNLQAAELPPPALDAGPGVYQLVANRNGFTANRLPFALDTLPECFEREPNNDQAHAQKVTLPVIINGRINKPDDWDVFQFTGKSNDTVVAEVTARRLDSPLDSVLKLTDAQGTLLAFNDDRDDQASGLNTHHADSSIMIKLPADGIYYVHLGDTARNGGEEYGYRLRLSAPQPDFALRVVPSSVSLRSNDSASVSIYAIRKDGFTASIKLGLSNPPPGFTAAPATLTGTQAMTRLSIKTNLTETKDPVSLTIEGRAKIGDKEIVNVAVPAEDRMQAFLWRHLVPANDLKVLVFDSASQLKPKHVAPVRPPPPVEAKPAVVTNAMAATATGTNAMSSTATGTNAASAGVTGTNTAAAVPAVKPKFTKQQVASRLRELKRLSEEGLLTDEFYLDRVAECETAQ